MLSDCRKSFHGRIPDGKEPPISGAVADNPVVQKLTPRNTLLGPP